MLKIIRRLPVNVWVGAIAVSAGSLLYANYQTRPISTSQGLASSSMLCSPLINTCSLPSMTNVSGTSNGQGGSLNSRMANLLQIQLLEMGLERLNSVSEYRSTFMKQERIGGTLTDVQEISLKIKQAPLSVYMQWLTCMEGREVLYVDGQNENKMLVHLEGVQGKLAGTMRLDPEGMLAMRESRHPITEVGLKHLVDKLLVYRKREAKKNFGFTCYCLDDQPIYNKKAIMFVTEYTSEEASPDYRKSVIYIDHDTMLPICVKNFAWPATSDNSQLTAAQLDEQTLIENYAYLNVSFDVPMIAADFDPGNKTYHFN